MKTSIFVKSMFLVVLVSFISLPVISGETSPFKINANLLKDSVAAGDTVPAIVVFSIASNHHIYKDQIRIESGNPEQFSVASMELPAGKIKFDTFLEKEVELYEGQIEIKSYIRVSKDVSAGSSSIRLEVHYQGCSDKICFTPKVEDLVLPVQVESTNRDVSGSQTKENLLQTESKSFKETGTGGFQKTIESKGIFVSLILIFLAGVGLSFTPCVYPMIPITVAVIGGQTSGEQTTARKPLKAFFLSLIYVLGIAIVYSALGVTAASTGALFGTALQSPWVIGFVVAVFVGLALSMFGVYYLRVPSFISDRLGKKTGKGVAGVFVMGLVSGIVASPCIGPALASLLVYIASTGNKFMGFWMLFVFAWGLGVLLIVLGTFSGAIKAIPKSGAWMEIVERIFGILMLGAALYYLRLIISETAFIIILGLFLIVVSVFSCGFARLAHKSTNFQRTKRAFGIVAFIFGTYFLIGHLIFKGLILPPFLTTTQNQSVATGEKTNWLFSEEEGIRQAKAENKTAMIDFWASWCAACMEFEKITYADPEVIRESRKFVNIKIDCTNTNDPKIKQLWEKYGIVGLPTIVFIDKDGNIIKDKTVTGFVNAEEFLRILKNL
ncbi:MAG TPA: protein-disulfide reductase DsbD family protein [Candidatus Wujingus californicus]|uniref:protein-disulfide reductase DsbD family protein n=1 Tax=Candidatus Wujingus californicus TaxID=3367618 RepID=UPI004026F3EA